MRPDLAEQKSRARIEARAARRSITVDHRRCCDTLALFLDEHVPADRRVVVYLAMGDEVDLYGLVTAHPRPHDRYALTRTPDNGVDLTVHRWGEQLERHRFGFGQPTPDSEPVADGDIGAVLVPGLAFDADGRRLGRGKGFYDRFLARLDPDCMLIGITGDHLAPEVPVDTHDVAMTHLAFSDQVVPVSVVPPPGRRERPRRDRPDPTPRNS